MSTEETKKGLEWLSDEELAKVAGEAINSGNFDSDDRAQAAFRELAKRTPDQ